MSVQSSLLMNLNHLLKPSIILAGEMLCRKKSMPRKKRKKLRRIACVETGHWLQSKNCPYFNLTWRMPFNKGDPQEQVSIQPPPTPGFSSRYASSINIYVMASDKLKQAPRAAWFHKFSSFLTASFFIKGSTVAVRILPCLFADVMVVASSFFYTLTTTFSPGMILLFYLI